MKWIEHHGYTFINKKDLVLELERVLSLEKISPREKQMIEIIIRNILKINGD